MTEQPDWQLIDRYLAGEASPDEARAVQAWMEHDPAGAALLQRLRERLGAGAVGADGWDVDSAWRRVAVRMADGAQVVSLDERRARHDAAARPAPAARPASRALAWRIAAGLLLAAAGLGTWRALESRRETGASAVANEALATRELVAARGEHPAPANLPDGSRVTLHAGSRLRYAPTLGAADAARDVWLDGEGYFEVTHDARRPFRVHARDAVAEDLGTRFVVRAYPELAAVDVAVAEGLVSLRRQPPAGTRRPSGDSAVVRAGERGRLPAGRGAPTVEPAGDLTRFIGWTAGTLALDGGTLAEALPRFERWYDVRVVLADRRLASRAVVARFRNEPLSQAIDELAIALGARVSRAGRTVTFYGRD